MKSSLLLLVVFALGCVNTQPAANYIYENNEKIIEGLEQVARATPADSEAAPLVRETLWRAAERQRPWTTQLRRYEGPTVVEVAKDMTDNRRLIEENRKLEELTQEIDFYEQPPFGEGSIGNTFLALLGGGLGGGGSLILLLLRKLAGKNQEVSKWMTSARHMFGVGNEIKATAPPEVVEKFKQLAAANPVVRETYEASKAMAIREQQVNAQNIQGAFGKLYPQ